MRLRFGTGSPQKPREVAVPTPCLTLEACQKNFQAKEPQRGLNYKPEEPLALPNGFNFLGKDKLPMSGVLADAASVNDRA